MNKETKAALLLVIEEARKNAYKLQDETGSERGLEVVRKVEEWMRSEEIEANGKYL